jgi:hypothetical protein
MMVAPVYSGFLGWGIPMTKIDVLADKYLKVKFRVDKTSRLVEPRDLVDSRLVVLDHMSRLLQSRSSLEARIVYEKLLDDLLTEI